MRAAWSVKEPMALRTTSAASALASGPVAAGVRSARAARIGAGPEDGVGDGPEVPPGMKDVDDLDHLAPAPPQELPGVAPDPVGPVPQHDHQRQPWPPEPPLTGGDVDPVPEERRGLEAGAGALAPERERDSAG